MVNIKKVIIVLFFIVFLSSIYSFGQKKELFYEDYKIDSNKTGILYFNLDNVNFFINNEFASEKTISYTLPGYRLTPKLSLALYDNILIEAGIIFLHYWGADKYPMYSYMGIPNWSSNKYQYFFHFLPYFRAKASLKENLHIVFGNLYNNKNHNLIEPINNPEYRFCSDEEMGVQILYNSKYFEVDTWLDWQSFIFKNDKHQEMFSFGVATKTNILSINDKLSFYIPLQFIIQHRGGGLDSVYDDNQSINNFAFGGGLSYSPKNFIDKVNLDFSCITSYQNSIESIPFKKGYGIYPKLSIEKQDFNLGLAYWFGKDFFSIYGSEHFFNYSTTTKDMVFDEISLIHAHLGYLLSSKRKYLIGFDFDVYYYMPFEGYREGYGDIYSSDYADFSFGIYLRINPEFKLRNLRNTF